MGILRQHKEIPRSHRRWIIINCNIPLYIRNTSQSTITYIYEEQVLYISKLLKHLFDVCFGGPEKGREALAQDWLQWKYHRTCNKDWIRTNIFHIENSTLPVSKSISNNSCIFKKAPMSTYQSIHNNYFWKNSQVMKTEILQYNCHWNLYLHLVDLQNIQPI